MVTTATTIAPTQRTGTTQRSTARKRAVTWPLSTQMPVLDELKRGLGYAWFGGNDIEEEGVWKWTDNTPWDFTNWVPQEPNDLDGNQDCLQINWSWDDAGCWVNKPFVCSKNVCLE